MSVDWSYVRLKDYCTKIGSGSTPRGGANVYLDSGSVCLIRSQNIYNDGFSENGLVFISNSDAEKLNNVEIELNDVLIKFYHSYFDLQLSSLWRFGLFDKTPKHQPNLKK